MQPVVLLSRCDMEGPPQDLGRPPIKQEMEEVVVGELQEVEQSVSTLFTHFNPPSCIVLCRSEVPFRGWPGLIYTCSALIFQALQTLAEAAETVPPLDTGELDEEGGELADLLADWAADTEEAEEGGPEGVESVAPINIEPQEEVGGGPQPPASAGPRRGMSPAVAQAVSQATLVAMGLVPAVASGLPPPTGTTPLAPAPPTGMGRSPGMSLDQWEALQASSGGGPSRSTGPGQRPSQRRATSTFTPSSHLSVPHPTGAGKAAQGAASSSAASLSSRAKKKARGFIPWNPTADQLGHAHRLLQGSGEYTMPPPLCLSLNDPRMGGRPSSQKWRCALCTSHYYSQLDCQGHTLAVHSQIRSPPVCSCGGTFNSAKALRDHLQLQHNISGAAVKKDPPVPLLFDKQRPMRSPPKGGN